MITKLKIGLVIVLAVSFVSISPESLHADTGCNWGELTSDTIATGFDQGSHSSDPSGDGHGQGTADEPRAGLANVVERGNLEATCELIDSLLPEND